MAEETTQDSEKLRPGPAQLYKGVKLVQVQTKLSPQQKEDLFTLAEEEGVKPAAVLRDAVIAYIQRRKRQKKSQFG